MSQRNYYEHDETGDQFEESWIFGGNDEKKRASHIAKLGKPERKPLREAIKDCLNNPYGYQGDEQYDPPSQKMRALHFALVNKLELENWENVRIYPALGTAADQWYGIDFLVRYTDPKTGNVYQVTCDLTTSAFKKESGHKADVIIWDTGALADPTRFSHIGSFELPDIMHASKKEDATLSQERIESTADIILRVLKEKIAGSDIEQRKAGARIEKRRITIRESLKKTKVF